MLDLAQLSDDAIFLRPPQRADAAAMHAAVCESTAEVGRWLAWCHEGYTLDEAAAWIEHCEHDWQSGESFPFFIFDRASGELAGGMGLNAIDRINRASSLGYWLRTRVTGRGLATRSAKLVLRFGIEQLGLVRISIIAAVGNLASQRVAERCGAKREGILRNRLFVGGHPVDAIGYSVIPGDLAPTVGMSEA